MTNNLFTTAWMFLLPLLGILLPVWLGQRYGSYVKRQRNDIQDAPIGTAVGATLGLLAFMLGFAFQIVGNRFDKRKELFISEVSDIRTSYLYAGLIPEPVRTKARNHLINYVDTRVELRNDLSKFEQVKSKSEQILDSLWNFSENLAAQDRSSEAYSLFISSISALINTFNERLVIYQFRLPQVVLNALSFVAFFTMIVLGYQFGISGKVSFMITLFLALTFAAVMWLVFALNYPEAGVLQINETPLLTLQEQLHRK